MGTTVRNPCRHFHKITPVSAAKMEKTIEVKN